MNAFILKNSKITFLFVLLIGLMTACQKEDSRDILTPTDTTTQNANFFQSQNRSSNDNQNNGNSNDEFLCFTISYPIEVLFPDGNTQTVNSDNELETTIDNWFDANPNAEEYPTLTFPINVTLEDGTTSSVANEDELCDLLEACWEDEWEDEESELDHLCFDFVYPITIVFPDGSSVTTNNDDELEEAVFGWYDANPDSNDDPTLNYPVEVVMESGAQITISNDEELEELVEACEGEYYDDCFTFNFPLTIVFPDGTTADANSDEEIYEIADAWYEANPNSEEELTLQFPITVTMEDGTERTLKSEEELEDLFEECYGEECEIEGNNLLLGGARSAVSKAVVAQQQVVN